MIDIKSKIAIYKRAACMCTINSQTDKTKKENSYLIIIHREESERFEEDLQDVCLNLYFDIQLLKFFAPSFEGFFNKIFF